MPKRFTMDLVALFVYKAERALAKNLRVSMVTMDVQGAFDALLKRRLLQRMRCQTRACIERLDDVVLFFSDQEITWSGVVYVYLLGTDHLISDVRLSTPLLAPCI